MEYVPLDKARFTIETLGPDEFVRIPARRNILLLIFFSVWLTFWTVGGAHAITAFATRFHLFLAVWLIGWALAWVMVSSAILWMLTGSERLRMVGPDLEVRRQAAFITRRKLFRGSEIKNVTATERVGWPHNPQLTLPFYFGSRDGSLRFDYGMRTYFVAAGLDLPEARRIAEWLSQRLPQVNR